MILYMWRHQGLCIEEKLCWDSFSTTVSNIEEPRASCVFPTFKRCCFASDCVELNRRAGIGNGFAKAKDKTDKAKSFCNIPGFTVVTTPLCIMSAAQGGVVHEKACLGHLV